ncbi:MAG: glutamine-hydrolyzing GMP synthase [Desulfovibrionaceae bacterium]|nr:glutamine-hydrolyzing GMP synthase [Desulfovibrionaceae bacterium]
MPQSKAFIIDYGSQVTQLIARRVREIGIYSEILPHTVRLKDLMQMKPGAIILSGGPASVRDNGAPDIIPGLLDLHVPILGICYGMQLLAKTLGGTLDQSKNREYGRASLFIDKPIHPLFNLLTDYRYDVWMSHGDRVITPPKGFRILAHTNDLKVAAFGSDERKIYGVQFHPEVSHTSIGTQVFKNFLFGIAGITPDWQMADFIKNEVEKLRQTIGDKHVICALSGGIDSTVVAALLKQAIGDNLHCIFVDNGLLRQDEAKQVTTCLKEDLHLNVTVVDAQKTFLQKLQGTTDPEEKRKIIGKTFIEIFEQEAKKLPQVDFLAQGTLYPDVIESVSAKGPSAVIKSHHNVGGLPDNMHLKLVEPLRALFKDEVRVIAEKLGLPEAVIHRQPFPGPGLAIRILGDITPERLEILRQADAIVQEEMRAADLYNQVWQSFAVLLPLKTVGVMGDNRTYENAIALRVVESVDAMTADWAKLPYPVLGKISSRIINEVKGVNRVVYDVSSKPPSTIEWE